jgi:hypothetical protein
MAEETYQEVADKIKEEVTESPAGHELQVIDESDDKIDDEVLEVKAVEKVAMKTKPPAPCRAKLRDKVTCPKCNKELSRHSYNYTHSKYCAGSDMEEINDIEEITAKMEKLTISEPKPKAKAKPKAKPKSACAIPVEENTPVPLTPGEKDDKGQNFYYIPNDEDIKRYLGNMRKEKAMKKNQGYERLIGSAF